MKLLCGMCGVLMALTGSVTASQIGIYTFTGALGDEATRPVDAQPANASFSEMRRGPGVSPTAGADTFAATSWPTNFLKDDAYFEFGITPASGFVITLTNLNFSERRSGTGIRSVAIASSLDNYLTGVGDAFSVPDNTSTRNQTIPLGPGFANLTGVTFRLYGFDAEAPGGTWRIDNVALFGSIQSVFSTLPASSVTSTSAVLNGVSSIGGTNLTLRFEYGLTPSYGNVTFATPSTATGVAPVAFSALLTNLQPSALYHFRTLGTNTTLSFTGENRTFFTPGLTGAIVNATAVLPDNRVLVGGSFTNLAGTAVRNLVRIHPDGSLDTTFSPEVAGEVHAIAVQLDEKVIIGGRFSHVNGIARNNLARLHTNGVLDVSYNPDIGGPVFALASEVKRYWWAGFNPTSPEATDPGLIYTPNLLVGGNFSRVGTNTTVRSFARLSTSGALITENLVGFSQNFTASLSGTPADVNSFLYRDDGQLSIGGRFRWGGAVTGGLISAHLNLATLSADGHLNEADHSAVTGTVRAIALESDRATLIGGTISSPGAFMARLNNPSFDPRPDGAVNTIAVQADGNIIIGGLFTNIQPNGSATPLLRKHLARLQSDGTADATFAPEFDEEVATVAIRADGVLAVGGRFTSVNGQPSPLFVLLTNAPAVSTLTATSVSSVVWIRGGTAPESAGPMDLSLSLHDGLGLVQTGGSLLEQSLDGGATWTPVPTDRDFIPAELSFPPTEFFGHVLHRRPGFLYANTGLLLTNDMWLRARAYTTDGSGSQGLVEHVYVLVLEPELRVETLEGLALSNGSSQVIGPQLIGQSTSRTIRLRSVGLAPITNLTLSVSGPNAAQFIVPSEPTPPAPLAATTGTSVFVVTFVPAISGQHTAIVHIVSNDRNDPMYQITFTGRGMALEDDEDGDGLSNGAEILLAASGFDFLIPNPLEIATLRSNGLFTVSDVQVLAGESTLLARDPVTGQFLLTMGLQRGTNLFQPFQLLPVTAPQLQVTPQGRIELRFTDPSDASFFYIDHSAP
ncbi:MAG TPA: hypothetical protein PKA51_10655 [Kiritimatiellia bacterium]|nr:hypothetical protein [Kiritimatiellia bacterium]